MKDDDGPGRPARGRLDLPLPSDVLPKSAECPFCGGTRTALHSAFGSALSVSQYYCRDCRTVFELMKRRPAGEA